MPPYLFAELDRLRERAAAQGVDVISLGVGDPDLPTADEVVAVLQHEAPKPEHHRYPSYQGLPSFRRAVAAYYAHRFGVSLDADREVVTCIGSKEGIAHLVWAYIDVGDVALVPDPAYPVYANQTLLAGGRVVSLPLRSENGFLPRFEDVPTDDARRAKMLFLNYPNNPTGAVASLPFFAEALRFARQYDLLVVHDAAYVEMTLEGPAAPSILQIEGAKEQAVEFYSLSKPFNMTGWRLAAMVGSADAVHALAEMKNQTDSGQFSAIQRAGEQMLKGAPETFIATMNATYRRRRDVLVSGLRSFGWQIPAPQATFYVWAPTPPGLPSKAFAQRVLEESGVVVVPGSGYGEAGEGYVRLCLTVPEDRLRQAVDRMRPVVSALF